MSIDSKNSEIAGKYCFKYENNLTVFSIKRVLTIKINFQNILFRSKYYNQQYW